MADNYIISTIFKIIDEATDPVRKIGRSLGGLSEGMSKMSSKLAASGKKMQTFGKDMSGVGTDLSMKLTAPFLLIGGYSLKAASDMESLTTSFETMMGSAEGAKNMMEELVKFANATPYELDEVANAARSLMAAGVGPEEITKKLTLLGDIASTAKIPLDELVRVYDKMKNKGKASLEELNPIAEKGIPIFQALADTMGVTKDQVFDMASKGRISFQLVEAELEKMTEKGGRYFEGMLKQSKTFAGAMSNFKGVIDATAVSFGTFLMNEMGLKDGLVSLTIWLDEARVSFQRWIKIHPTLFKWLVIVAGAIATIGPLLLMLGSSIGMVGMAITGLGKAFSVIGSLTMKGTSMALLKIVIIAAAILAIMYLVKKAFDAIDNMKLKSINDRLSDMKKAIKFNEVELKLAEGAGDKDKVSSLQQKINQLMRMQVDIEKEKRELTGDENEGEKNIIEKIKDKTDKIKEMFQTAESGSGKAKEDLYTDSAVYKANQNIASEQLKASVSNGSKSEVHIVLELPDGVKAIAKNKKTDRNTNLIFDMNYNAGYLNPGLAGG